MPGLRDEPVVAGQRGELVERSPGHVQRDEVLEDSGGGQGGHVTHVSLRTDTPADPRVAGVPGGVGRVSPHPFAVWREVISGLAEESAERLAVPELFVDPARKERRDLGIERGPGRQKVAQEDDRVRLDVHHVCEASRLSHRQRVVPDRFPGHARQVHLLRGAQISVEVEVVHGCSVVPPGSIRDVGAVGLAGQPPAKDLGGHLRVGRSPRLFHDVADQRVQSTFLAAAKLLGRPRVLGDDLLDDAVQGC